MRLPAVSGGELIQPRAVSAGAEPLSASLFGSTVPEIDDGFEPAANATLTTATTAIAAAASR